MQRELRALLEKKAAMGAQGFLGGDYYYDMSGRGEYDDGELVAGGRRRKAKKLTPMQKKMKKVRAAKKRRGGDFVDLNDSMPYIGAGRKKATQKGFRNPLEKAERDEYKAIADRDWLVSYGPEYAAKLTRKAAIINRALARTNLAPVGRAYNAIERANMANLAAYKPYADAARRAGVKMAPVDAVWPAAPANAAAYNALIEAARAPVDYVAAPNLAALGANGDEQLAAYNALFQY